MIIISRKKTPFFLISCNTNLVDAINFIRHMFKAGHELVYSLFLDSLIAGFGLLGSLAGIFKLLVGLHQILLGVFQLLEGLRE